RRSYGQRQAMSIGNWTNVELGNKWTAETSAPAAFLPVAVRQSVRSGVRCARRPGVLVIQRLHKVVGLRQHFLQLAPLQRPPAARRGAGEGTPPGLEVPAKGPLQRLAVTAGLIT